MHKNNLLIILFIIGLYCANAYAKYYCPKNTEAKTIIIDGKPDFEGNRVILDETRSVERYFARDGSYFYFGIKILDRQLAATSYRKHFFVSTNPLNEKERFTFHWDEMKPIITSTLDNDPEMECATTDLYSECRIKNMWNTLEVIRSSSIDPLDHVTICTLDFSASGTYQQASEKIDQAEIMLAAEQTTNTTIIDARKRNFVVSGLLASAMLVITFVVGIIFLFREKLPDSVAFEKKDN